MERHREFAQGMYDAINRPARGAKSLTLWHSVVAMRPPGTTADRIIAELATRSRGVVTTSALIAAGVTPAEVRSRLRRGSLIREHRGVLRVGHRAPSVETAYLAAVLACGERAVLSGLAAAYLYGLVRGKPPPPQVTTRNKRRLQGVKTRRARNLDPRDTTNHRGIPVTSIARTLVDMAPVLPVAELGRAVHEARVKHGITPERIEAALGRRPNSPGARKLRRVLRGDERIVLSKLEGRFLELLERAGLPPPHTNEHVGGRYVDCRWRHPPLTVELDSYRYHGSRHAWEQDRRREREAYARGDELRRYTFADVYEDPRATLDELRRLLQPDVQHHRRE